MSEIEQPAIVPSDDLEPGPADNVIRKMPEFQYTKDELMKLRNTPAAMRKPDVLDDPYLSSILKIPDDNRGGKGPGAGRTEIDKEKGQRRPADRLRSEEEFSGPALLSPQRPYKSSTWGEGCHVNKNADKGLVSTVPNRAHEELERDVPLQPQRRLGPQRPLRPETGDRGAFYQSRERDSLPRDKYGRSEHCDRDRVERESFTNKDRRERGGFERENVRGGPVREQRDFRNGNRDQRDKFGRDGIDSRKPGERLGPRGGQRDQWSNRPYGYHGQDEEPEWMSAGPTSKYDTIELKGFEDEERKGKGKQDKDREEKPAKPKEERKAEVESGIKETEEPAAKTSRPPSRRETPVAEAPPETRSAGTENAAETKLENGLGFNLDDFNKLFTLDSLPDVPLGELLEDFGGGLREDSNEGSKFSKFFSAGKTSEEPAKAGSFLMKLGLNEEKAEAKQPATTVDPNQILGEFLKDAQKRGDVPPPPIPSKKVPQKALRLEDLEGGVASQKKEKPEAGMDAFKKLLAQVESKGLTNGGLPNETTKALPKSAMTEEEFLSSVIGGSKDKMTPTSQPSHFSPQMGAQNDSLSRLANAVKAQQQQHHVPRPSLMNQPPPVSVGGFPPMVNDQMIPNQHPALQTREAQTLLKALSTGRLSVQDLLKHLSDPRFDKHLASISEQVLQVVAPREFASYARGQFVRFPAGIHEASYGAHYFPPVMQGSQQRPPVQQTKSVYADIPLSVIKRMTANKEAEAGKAKSDVEAQVTKSAATTAAADVSSVAGKTKVPSKLTGRTVSQLPQQVEKQPSKEIEKSAPLSDGFNSQPRQAAPVFPHRADGFPNVMPPYGSDPRLGPPQQTMGRSQSEGILQQLMSGALQQQQQRLAQYAPRSPGLIQGYPPSFDFQAKMRAERPPLAKEGLLSQMMGSRGGQSQLNNFFPPQMQGHGGFHMGMYDNLEKSIHK